MSDKNSIHIANDDEVAQYGALGGEAAEFSAEAPGRETVESLRKERDDLKDKLLRAQAECANISRRLQQQHGEAMKYAAMDLARGLLGVLDNLERSLETMQAAGIDESQVHGIRLTIDEFVKTLRSHGVEPIETVGRPFDPTRHEAVRIEEDPTSPPGTVVAELQRGYLMNGRVLRPAKVAVTPG